jgi:hypothetical protein
MESVIAQLKAGNRKPYDEWVDYVKANYGGERVAGKSVVFGN